MGRIVPPAYYVLKLGKTSGNASDGVNFASGGCGILNTTKPPAVGPKNWKCLSLVRQVELFNDTAKDLSPTHLAESVVLVSSGANDFMFGFNESLDANQFADHLVTDFISHLTSLHKMGARKFVINNIGPAGCIPEKVDQLTGKCDEVLNRDIKTYNAKLIKHLQAFKSIEKDSHLMLADNHEPFNKMLNFPIEFGFRFTKTPCCGTWYIGRLICSTNSDKCSDRRNYLFFDGVHTTDTANRMWALLCAYGKYCSPIEPPKSMYALLL